MKIYTRIVMDSMTGKVEDADFFEYEGPIAELKDSPSPPPAPDYAGAARATSAGTVQASIANNLMARPNVYNPLGSQTWKQTGTQTIPGAEGNAPVDIPTYQQNVNLTPQGQGLFDQQLRLSRGVGDVAEGQLGRVGDAVSQPFSVAGLPERVSNVAAAGPGPTDLNAARDATTNAIIARNQPLMDRQRSMLATQLRNQGLVPGGEAYGNAQDDLGRQENDFRLAAIAAGNAEQNQLFGQDLARGNQAFGQDVQNAGLANQVRATGIQEEAYLRGLPLSEFNAFRTGAQPAMPQFQPTSYSMDINGPNMTGALRGQNQYDMGLYNSRVDQNNSMTSGLFSLGRAALPFLL